MPGCPACHDYLPRLTRQIEGFKQYKIPFEIYDDASKIPDKIPEGTIPVFVYDATSPDPELQAICNRNGITGMPTTLLMTRSTQTIKIEGAVDDAQIYQLLIAASSANA